MKCKSISKNILIYVTKPVCAPSLLSNILTIGTTQQWYMLAQSAGAVEYTDCISSEG